MKTIIIIILLISSCIFRDIGAQCDTGELTKLLYSSDVYERINAAQRIAECNLYELLPLLEERFYEEGYLYSANRILFVLAKLKSERLEEITLEFINRVDYLTTLPPDDRLGSKVYATQILFDLENYSTIDYIYQIVERDRPNYNFLTVYLLSEFINNDDLSQYEEYGKEELINMLNSESDFVVRAFIVDELAIKYGMNLVNLFLDKVYNDPEWSVRLNALEALLKIKYYNAHAVYFERLHNDPNQHIRWEIADTILSFWGEPQDLKEILDYYPNEPDPVVKKDMWHSTNVFIPPKPGGLSYGDLFLRLISYNDEMFEYGWIQNEETKEYYFQKLNAVNEAALKNESEEACEIINDQILSQTEQDLKDQLITTEGYKFLHYYTIYIREEIEADFGSCN